MAFTVSVAQISPLRDPCRREVFIPIDNNQVEYVTVHETFKLSALQFYGLDGSTGKFLKSDLVANLLRNGKDTTDSFVAGVTEWVLGPCNLAVTRSEFNSLTSSRSSRGPQSIRFQ